MRIGFRGFGVAPKSITDAPPVAVACSAQGPRTTTCSKICADKTSASRSRAWIGMPQFVAVGLEGKATNRGCGAGATLPTPERPGSGPCAPRAARGGARAVSAERRSHSRRRQLPGLHPVPREDGNQHAVALRVVADVGRARHAGDQLHFLAGFIARYGRITPARDEDPAADDLDTVEPARALGDHTGRLVSRLPREHRSAAEF